MLLWLQTCLLPYLFLLHPPHNYPSFGRVLYASLPLFLLLLLRAAPWTGPPMGSAVVAVSFGTLWSILHTHIAVCRLWTQQSGCSSWLNISPQFDYWLPLPEKEVSVLFSVISPFHGGCRSRQGCMGPDVSLGSRLFQVLPTWSAGHRVDSYHSAEDTTYCCECGLVTAICLSYVCVCTEWVPLQRELQEPSFCHLFWKACSLADSEVDTHSEKQSSSSPSS